MTQAKAKVLILGGTAEARALAGLLCKEGHAPTTSLAGITRDPGPIRGVTREGGFGGAAGLAQYLEAGRFTALIDATHPFAQVISGQAKQAAESLGLPLLRLERPAWTAEAGDRWTEVPDNDAALRALPSGASVLLTIGRKELMAYLARPDISGVARMIEPLETSPPASWRILLARPPFTLAEELRLFDGHAISHLVTKNSGGEETRSKLAAARLRGVDVVMIARPAKPAARTAADPHSLLILLDEALSA